ncbi:hypothetical protein LCL95_09980 [Bacillus timonensis]|nr:hypothetical protein [Bacillus timonensis]
MSHNFEKKVIAEIRKTVNTPLFVSVCGSRMCGYEEDDSDWDIFIIYDNQLVKEHVHDYRFLLNNEEVSLRFEEQTEIIDKINKCNIKLYEKFHTPFIWLSTTRGETLRQMAFNLSIPLLIESYISKILLDVLLFKEKSIPKAIIYAYRRSLTAHGLLKNRKCIINFRELTSIYPESLLEKLAYTKIMKKPLTCGDKAVNHINLLIEELRRR